MQKLTTGYGDRLREALGDRSMSVRQLAGAVRERYPGLRGTSDGGVRQYVDGNVRNPRVELLRAFADVLGVRWQKIAHNEGAWTAEREELRGATEGATSGESRADALVRAGMESLLEAVPFKQHLVFEYRHLSQVVIKIGSTLAERGLDLSTEDCYRRAGRLLGEALAAPAQILGIGDDPDERTAQAYITACAFAIELVAHHARIRQPRTPRPRR